MNRRIIAIIMAVIIGISFAGCSKDRIEQKNENKIQESYKSEKQGKEKNEPLMTNSRKETKEKIKRVLPGILENVKNLLIDNSQKIHRDFDMSNIQFLLVSNVTDTTYLMNNQNKDLGGSDEIIEYATNTIKDTGIRTGGFQRRDFNGYDTYVFEIDTLARITNKEDLEEFLFHVILHEAVHIFYQKENVKNFKTAESGSNSISRSEEYPVDPTERILRAEMMYYLREALKSSGLEREENIQKANYFYVQYLKLNEENQNLAVYDMTEGQARYFEFRGDAILENPEAGENEIVAKTTQKFLNENSALKYDSIVNMLKQKEYYDIGSTAYALIYDMGLSEKIGSNNPLEYLLDKYGDRKNNGNKEIEKGVISRIDEKNQGLKKTVDFVENRMDNDEYINIRIPEAFDRPRTSSMLLRVMPIKYNFLGDEGTINKVDMEIKIKDNRIKFTEAYVIMRDKIEEGSKLKRYYDVFVPKSDVNIEGDKISVQSDEVQLYDMDFTVTDGAYVVSK